MRAYGNKSLSYVLYGVLDIIFIIGIFIIFSISKEKIIDGNINIHSYKEVITYVLFIIGSISLLSIVINLRSIVKTLININPFIKDNVKNLELISYKCFSISGCYIINFLINCDYSKFRLIYIDSIGVHTDLDFFIFLLVGVFIFILSKVFKQAVEVKEENDFTI